MRRIDETLCDTGRPGSGCRPLHALTLAQNHRTADPPALRLSEGRCEPKRPSPPLCRCPPAYSRSVMFPTIGPIGGLAMW